MSEIQRSEGSLASMKENPDSRVPWVPASPGYLVTPGTLVAATR